MIILAFIYPRQVLLRHASQAVDNRTSVALMTAHDSCNPLSLARSISYMVVRCGASPTAWLYSTVTSLLEVWMISCSGQHNNTTTRTSGEEEMVGVVEVRLTCLPLDRPLPFYEALAKEAYNTHISNPEVSLYHVHSCGHIPPCILSQAYADRYAYPSISPPPTPTLPHTHKQRDFVFMDICIEGELIGRLVFELYKHLCPQTCANFAALCTGEQGVSRSGVRLSYVNSLFHRVVQGGWIQGGGRGRSVLLIHCLATVNSSVLRSNSGIVLLSVTGT